MSNSILLTTNDFTIKCDLCDKTFDTKQNADIHVENEHGNNCDKCGYKCKSKFALQTHFEYVHKVIHECKAVWFFIH